MNMLYAYMVKKRRPSIPLSRVKTKLIYLPEYIGARTTVDKSRTSLTPMLAFLPFGMLQKIRIFIENTRKRKTT